MKWFWLHEINLGYIFCLSFVYILHPLVSQLAYWILNIIQWGSMALHIITHRTLNINEKGRLTNLLCKTVNLQENMNKWIIECVLFLQKGGEKTKVINEVVLLNSFKVCQTTKVFSINFLYWFFWCIYSVYSSYSLSK